MRRIVAALAVLALVLFPVPALAADPPVVSASLTLAADAKSVATGATVTLSGTLRGKTAEGETVPLTERAVTVQDVSGSTEALTATTDAQGRFTVTAAPRWTVTWEAVFTLADEQVFSRPVAVRVLAKALLFDFAVKHNTKQVVTAKARFKLGSDRGEGAAYTVNLQFSPDGKVWRTVQALRPDHEGRLAASFRQAAPGWWRMSFPGSAEYAPAVTKVVKVWRWKTSITGLKVTPRKLKVGKKITITGTLKRFNAKNKKKPVPYAGRKVTAIFKCAHGDSWYSAVTAKTTKKGTFTLRPKTWCDAKFQVVFDGTADTFRAYSRTLKVDTKGKPLL
ncbi:hypothetical protein LO762_01755 [Actinocorallia sp. API 0066]|uniref:hypothetical protein n=1 Tax=Actinocorallia sp. API 0066 TaxID=2896846 RepID=UPI001E4A4BF6|nr:hypothetical protein [Actinocorallia sp. API 0066]MCD0447924.1 hypothetical protein [Actinocorallia sp. API 0066]